LSIYFVQLHIAPQNPKTPQIQTKEIFKIINIHANY